MRKIINGSTDAQVQRYEKKMATTISGGYLKVIFVVHCSMGPLNDEYAKTLLKMNAVKRIDATVAGMPSRARR